MDSDKHFLPAAGHDWLLPFYDPLNRLLGEEKLKGALLDQAELGAGQRLLDIGCGTGALTLLAKRREPTADVVGLDPDPKALARAREKAAQANLEVRFDQGFATELPYPDASFDRAFSSMMYHHLAAADKGLTLRELLRVLAPGGSLHLLDFGPPRGRLAKLLTRLIHHHEIVGDNLSGAIPGQIAEAGFEQAGDLGFRTTFLGTLWYYRGVKPTAGAA